MYNGGDLGAPWPGSNANYQGLILLRIGNLWPRLRKGGNGFKYPVCYSFYSEAIFFSFLVFSCWRILISCQWLRWTEQQVAVILFLRWIIISQDNDTLCISVYCSPGMFSICQSGSRMTNHWPIRAGDGPDFNLFIGPSLWILNPRHYTDKECWQHQLANGCRPLVMIKHQDNPAFSIWRCCWCSFSHSSHICWQ